MSLTLPTPTNPMVAKTAKSKMPVMESCMLRVLHQVQKIRVEDIVKDRKTYPGFEKFSSATMYRHAKKPLDGSSVIDRQTMNKGRPRKLNAVNMRHLCRNISKMRTDVGTFTSKELQEACGFTQIKNSTFRLYLQRAGYGWRKTRKKGLLMRHDLKKRLTFVRKVKRNFPHGSLLLS